MRASLAVLAMAVAASAQGQYTAHVLHSGAVPSPRSFGWGAGGGQQVGHTNIILNGPSNALLWEGSAGSFVNLHPAGFAASYAMDTDGTNQVGWREVAGVGSFATMWSGTAESWMNLNPSSYRGSIATGIGGGQQVGFGNRFDLHPDLHEAMLWHGTPESIVNLHPGKDYIFSTAEATDGQQQVGTVTPAPGFDTHAALWTGSAASFVDLNPAGYVQSEALGVTGGEQVGWASPLGNAHAMLWRGSAASFVDLNPGPNHLWGSRAFDTNGTTQVGLASTNFRRHAAAWNGTPESYIDLSTFLPSQFHGKGSESWARGIDEFGNIVGWALDLQDGERAKAVLWTPIPEPTTAAFLSIGVLYLAFRCRRSRSRPRRQPE